MLLSSKFFTAPTGERKCEKFSTFWLLAKTRTKSNVKTFYACMPLHTEWTEKCKTLNFVGFVRNIFKRLKR